jgi:phospholipid/cholesterol/gamma-HCH transport system substrate-binding protein
MERDARYGAVGAFVLVVIAMATVFVLWYTNARERREYVRYEVYFQGSVSGLNEGSTVRYLGVNVGVVARIRIDHRDPTRVQVLIDVDATTPVNRGTVARLSLQGVTGLLFIDLSQSTTDVRATLRDVPSERYPVIPSVASDLEAFLSGLPALVTDVRHVTDRLNRLLADENLQAIADTLKATRAAAATLPHTAAAADQLVSDLRGLAAEARATTDRLHQLTVTSGPDVEAAAQRIRSIADNLNATSAQLNALFSRHQAELDRFAGQGLTDFARLMRDGRDAADEVRALAQSLRQDPSQLLYQPPERGVALPK